MADVIKIKINIDITKDENFIGCGSFDDLNDAIDYLYLIKDRVEKEHKNKTLALNYGGV